MRRGLRSNTLTRDVARLSAVWTLTTSPGLPATLDALDVATADEPLIAPSPLRDVWEPQPYQLPPPDDEDWDTWVLRAGRGSGKTLALSQYGLEHLRRYGPLARVGFGAPTKDDVRDYCAEGPSGIITLGGAGPGTEFPIYHRGMMQARHRDGGFIQFLGSEAPARWNGRQWSLLLVDELDLWNQRSWQEAQFGLRIGTRPRVAVAATPKGTRWVRDLLSDPQTRVARASTFDNTSLPEARLASLLRRYGGTDLGRRELYAEELDELEGAKWKRAWIDAYRVQREQVPDLRRVVVAIDPAGSHKPSACETGIVVAGEGVDGHLYVLDSKGGHWAPGDWAKLVEVLARVYGADLVVCERNYGGDLARANILQAWPQANVQMVTATRGKVIRAEPVAARYQQGFVHHVGVFSDLEDQQCTYTGYEPADAVLADRMDALVWALTALMEGWTPPQTPSAPMVFTPHGETRRRGDERPW